MTDSSALQMVLMALTGWLERRERSALAYLIEEKREIVTIVTPDTLLRWHRQLIARK